jgi:hypothetical protein
MKEMMKTGDHNLAKRHAEMTNDFGSSSFGGLIKMAKTHTNIVRIFRDEDTNHSCICILKTPDGEKESNLEKVGQKLGFNDTSKNGGKSRPSYVMRLLRTLGFDRHPRCAIAMDGPAPKGFPKNPVHRSDWDRCLQISTHPTWDYETADEFTTHANGNGPHPMKKAKFVLSVPNQPSKQVQPHKTAEMTCLVLQRC